MAASSVTRACPAPATRHGHSNAVRRAFPPGIAVIAEPDAPVLTEDVTAGTLSLPTGRVVADAALIGQASPLPDIALPGTYPVSVTVGRMPGDSSDQVAYLTLVVSDAPTARWVATSSVAVDGGTAGFTSAEGSDLLGRMDPAASVDASARAFDALTAHDGIVATVPIGDDLDLALATSGYGDGVYGVHVGLDADGKPTRYVIDFGVVHLAWP